MKCNGLKCRCGKDDSWQLEWAYTGLWELNLICNECGAVYTIGQSEKENISVSQLVYESWQENKK